MAPIFSNDNPHYNLPAFRRYWLIGDVRRADSCDVDYRLEDWCHSTVAWASAGSVCDLGLKKDKSVSRTSARNISKVEW